MDEELVYVQPRWQQVHRRDVAAVYCRSKWCVRFTDPYSAVRVLKRVAVERGLRPCSKCWAESDTLRRGGIL